MLDIQESILKADLVLCEMSERNPNVFYELGLAHAVGKPAILVARKEEDIPFDLRHIRVIVYDYTRAGWEEKLRQSITAAAQAVTDTSEVWPPPMVTPAADPNTASCPLEIALSSTKNSFYFHSVGVKRDLIATVFVLWVEIINRSTSSITVLETLLDVADKRLSNSAKPKRSLPYSNVTYVRETMANDNGAYLEFDEGNADFGFRPHINEENLIITGGNSRSGSLIFWMFPPDTSLTGDASCRLVIRTSQRDAQLQIAIKQRGV
jgi:hypothetical protein